MARALVWAQGVIEQPRVPQISGLNCLAVFLYKEPHSIFKQHSLINIWGLPWCMGTGEDVVYGHW